MGLVGGIPLEKRESTGRIDTHIHAIPQTYVRALQEGGQDDNPAWSIGAAKSFMNSTGISVGMASFSVISRIILTDIAILSLSTPGVSIAGTGIEARSLARTLNEELASYISYDQAASIGFFGTLPDWRDVDGVLAELDYLYTEQKLCSGVAVYTTYGTQLLGDAMFRPIWQRLQQYKALVFIHPTAIEITPELIGPGLPQFVIDFLCTWSEFIP